MSSRLNRPSPVLPQHSSTTTAKNIRNIVNDHNNESSTGGAAFEEQQQLIQLKQALTDLTFSFSTNSFVITEQAKVRCKEVHQTLMKIGRDWVSQLISSQHCYDVFYDTILFYCNLNQFYNVNPIQHQHLEVKRSQCLQHLRDCFGSDSLLLADFYYLVAIQLEKNNIVDDAVEFAGRSLFIRIKCTGIVSVKTAESHYLLGCLYYKKEFDEESRKELTAARMVYSKLDGTYSMLVADCNQILGQLELRSYNYAQAFSAFLKCYRSRFFILGEKHNNTVTAFTLLQQTRTSGGSRFLGGIELKERVEHLKWTSLPQIAQPHVIALFINRLDDEHILTFEQLDSLVSAALVYHENIIANQRANYGNYSSKSHDSLNKQQAIALLLEVTVPIFRERCTSSSSSSQSNTTALVTTSSSSSTQKSPITPPMTKTRSIERPKQIIATGTMKLASSSVKAMPMTPPRIEEQRKQLELVIVEETPSAPEEDEANTALSPQLSTSAIAVREGGSEEKTSSSGEPQALDSQSDQSAKSQSALQSSKAKRTWRPISLHSPLRIAATGGLSAFSNIDMQGKSFRLIRNETGGIYYVRRCSIEFLRKAFRSKFVALGLLAWLAAGNSLATKKSNPLLGGGGGGSSSAGGDSSDKSDAKNALNALFGKKLGGPPGIGGPPKPPTDTGKTGDSADKSKTTKFAPNPPCPPPLPVCWPPVPYTGEEATAGSKSEKGPPGSDDAKDSTAEGPVDPNAPIKPKLKQVFLTSLASIEGTFWAEPQEILISADQLFDDLEEEFAIAAKKKPVAFGSGGKNPTAEKVNKPAAKPVAESVLDPQRTQNINIMLAKFGKKTMESIAELVMNMDAANLGGSAITALSQFIPTPDETSRVSKFILQQHSKGPSKLEQESKPEDKGSAVPPPQSTGGSNIDTKRLVELKIGKAEQYIYFMSKIKKMEKRLSAMSSILSANELNKNVIEQSETLLNAVSEVKGSGRLKFLLKTFLDLNNALAKYAKNGTVMSGINIASWSKLSQVKLNSGETAYQYVVNKLLGQVPEALELSNDMPSIDEAKSVMLNRLSADVRKLEEAVVLLTELLTDDTNENKDKEASSVSVKNLTTYTEDLKKLHQTAKERFEMAQKDFCQCCTYYGESSPPMEPEAFFGEISALCKSLQTAASAAGTKQRRKAVTK